MKLKVIKHKESPAPITSEQAERSFSQIAQRFLKSEQYFFKPGITVKPESLERYYEVQKLLSL